VAPAGLDENERRVFVDIVGACEPEHFRPSDMPLLVAYVRATLLESRAAQELVREPVSPKGQVSPWAVIQSNALKSMLGLSLRLRLAPQSRKAVSTKRPQQLSYYERIAIEGQ
jgi:hypothetical protein